MNKHEEHLSNLPEAIANMLKERRELITQAATAGGLYHNACKPLADYMGLVGKEAQSLPEYHAWRAAEAALADFYLRYPLKQYKKEFNADSIAWRFRHIPAN